MVVSANLGSELKALYRTLTQTLQRKHLNKHSFFFKTEVLQVLTKLLVNYLYLHSSKRLGLHDTGLCLILNTLKIKKDIPDENSLVELVLMMFLLDILPS